MKMKIRLARLSDWLVVDEHNCLNNVCFPGAVLTGRCTSVPCACNATPSAHACTVPAPASRCPFLPGVFLPLSPCSQTDAFVLLPQRSIPNPFFPLLYIQQVLLVPSIEIRLYFIARVATPLHVSLPFRFDAFIQACCSSSPASSQRCLSALLCAPLAPPLALANQRMGVHPHHTTLYLRPGSGCPPALAARRRFSSPP